MKAKYIIANIMIGAALLYACDKDKIELPQPENNTMSSQGSSLYYKTAPQQEETTFTADGSYTFAIKTGKAATDAGTVTLLTGSMEKIVKDYNVFKGASDYSLLPAANYTFEGSSYSKGATEAEVKVTIKDFASLDYGDYLLPLKVEMAGQQVFHLVKVHKDGDYTALSETSKKPMPPGTYSCPDRKEPMKMVAYVETNDWDIRNMGQFILKDSKKPIFDIVVLFAANMNYDAKKGKRYLFFNDKLQPILKDPDKYIKPLRDRGIKVIVDILPNHQGVGYYNFQNYEEALEFARECKQYADKYGFDGYDIDEEYAEYYKLPQKPTKDNESILWFMRAMKEVMPDKLLTLYDYGHYLSSSDVDDQGKGAKDYLDYSWANYWERHGSYSGVPKEKYGQYSIEANWSTSYTTYSADYNLQGCYGLLMIFNINGRDIKSGDVTDDLSDATRKFYGEECIFSGKYHKGPKDR
jgi:endo-beta-N-acetylglucosaminidase H|nr:DUF1735 domain-containing protein [uncultured Capnocytophaga sp.]